MASTMMSTRFIMSTSSATPRTPTSLIPPPAVLPLKPIPGTYAPPPPPSSAPSATASTTSGSKAWTPSSASARPPIKAPSSAPTSPLPSPSSSAPTPKSSRSLTALPSPPSSTAPSSTRPTSSSALTRPASPSPAARASRLPRRHRPQAHQSQVLLYGPPQAELQSLGVGVFERPGYYVDDHRRRPRESQRQRRGGVHSAFTEVHIQVPLQGTRGGGLGEGEGDQRVRVRHARQVARGAAPAHEGTGVIPQPLEEIFLHSFPLPFLLVKNDYSKLYEFLRTQGKDVVDNAVSEYGLSTEEEINNILFVLGFNAFGGFSVFFPKLITTIGSDETGLQEKLREEVRRVVGTDGVLDLKKVREMELVTSTVRELLRLNPPVPLQYGRARRDFTLSSHEASFEVKRGELLCGYQPLTMRDAKVFEDPDRFVPDRFVEAKGGEELLEYLYWSNGRETGTPSVENKQCAAKDYVVGTACLFVAYLFTRYDGFRCEPSSFSISTVEKARDGKD
ncbi:hypothetical protein QJS10_CPA03g00715 [Acorus calamus]|uniref:Uncharacterized protein n=1 Tax=Acorus calamus TaxID=4465 RepID=A0AAV9F576_ACOCL|nr:hypothetical protein QJS10_CPA03g00715 [Acorus calamus]